MLRHEKDKFSKSEVNIMKSILCSCLLVCFVFCGLDAKDKREDVVRGWEKTPKVVEEKDQICFAMYTVDRKTLRMTAFLFPLKDSDSREIVLQVKKDSQWKQVAKTKIRENSYGTEADFKNKKVAREGKAWNALFKVESWDDSKDYQYRVVALNGKAAFTGTIRRNPIDKNVIVVAAFTGNSPFNKNERRDMITVLKAQNPDLLFFSGDQTYNHTNHMRGWLEFGWQFRDIIRDRPTICIPDDHDVGHGNLWGADGKKSHGSKGYDGGYKLSANYVNEVQFAQTANLPEPFDPTHVQQGIGVYYTSYNLGEIDFAIIEDRKFKSTPKGLIPGKKGRPEIVKDPKFTPDKLDVKGAVLLGDRQLNFLGKWSRNWENAQMKCVFSQSVFAGLATHIGKEDGYIIADMDSNGWPATGRNKALKKIRKGFAFMIGGDQHLATVAHHGVDEFGDAGYSFGMPSIVNHFGRWWKPIVKPKRRVESVLEHTGDYLDGFGNHITMYAYANPGEYEIPLKTPNKYIRRATGHGIILFNKKERTITMECCPRGVDVSKPDAKQFPGWPITIKQEDNYGRKAVAYLPTIKVNGKANPVVQVINEETKDVVYTIRIKGNAWRPKVFSKSLHTIKIGEGDDVKVFKHIKPESKASKSSLIVVLPQNL